MRDLLPEVLAARGKAPLWSMERLAAVMRQVADLKAAGHPYEESFASYEYCSSGGYFGLAVEDPLDPEQITVELWLSMGALTDGRRAGYERGFRFEVGLVQFDCFVAELDAELRQALHARPSLS